MKTSLKLLLFFVEYTDTNCLLFLNAIDVVDSEKGKRVLYVCVCECCIYDTKMIHHSVNTSAVVVVVVVEY